MAPTAPARAKNPGADHGGTARGDTRHAGLVAGDVVAAALDIVERDGADGLTMRKLASELGVTTTTIYWHVGNRDELVIALIRRLADQQAATEVSGDTPRDRVTSAALNIWRNALAHRNVTALAGQVGASTLLELPLEVAVAAELEAAGLAAEDVRDALRAILLCIAGFLVGAWRSEDRVPPALRREALWAQVDDGRLDARTLEVVGAEVDLDQLVAATISGVVAAWVPTTGTTSERSARKEAPA